MDVFLFEYVTSGGEVPEEIITEGLGMFKSLYAGFNKFQGVRKVNSFVKPEYRDSLGFNGIEIGRFEATFDVIQKVEEFAEKSDCSLIIAPEDDGLLLNLTKIAENKSENLGSSVKGISVTSDKWEMYKRLKKRVNVPLTSKKPLEPPFVLKPRISCGGEGIQIIKTKEENPKIESEFIAQKLIKGRDLSVSLLVGEELNVISVNGQLIENFRYKGAEVPAQIDKKDFKLVFEEVTKAVECIKGLHGYVGVDVVLAEVPYIIEVNARLTTPSIIFDRVYGINLAEMIFKNHYGGLESNLGSNLRSIKMSHKRPFRLKKVEKDKIRGKIRDWEVIVDYRKNALVFHKI